jgi:hypothetical protein
LPSIGEYMPLIARFCRENHVIFLTHFIILDSGILYYFGLIVIKGGSVCNTKRIGLNVRDMLSVVVRSHKARSPGKHGLCEQETNNKYNPFS